PVDLRRGHGRGCGEAGERALHAGSDYMGKNQESRLQSGRWARGVFPPPEDVRSLLESLAIVLKQRPWAAHWRRPAADFRRSAIARPIEHPARIGKVLGSGTPVGVARKPWFPVLSVYGPTIWPLALIPKDWVL